jgi:hypothetical protein
MAAPATAAPINGPALSPQEKALLPLWLRLFDFDCVRVGMGTSIVWRIQRGAEQGRSVVAEQVVAGSGPLVRSRS